MVRRPRLAVELPCREYRKYKATFPLAHPPAPPGAPPAAPALRSQRRPLDGGWPCGLVLGDGLPARLGLLGGDCCAGWAAGATRGGTAARGFCPSCAGRRMAQTAAHLVECVIPWGPTRQWVVSVPIPLRYWMSSSKELTAKIHTILRTTISQYYVNQAVKRGVERQKVQPGSVTFIQRFGGAINLMMSS